MKLNNLEISWNTFKISISNPSLPSKSAQKRREIAYHSRRFQAFFSIARASSARVGLVPGAWSSYATFESDPFGLVALNVPIVFTGKLVYHVYLHENTKSQHLQWTYSFPLIPWKIPLPGTSQWILLVSNQISSPWLTFSKPCTTWRVAKWRLDEVKLLMVSEIWRKPVEVGSLSSYLHNFIHLRWLFLISAIFQK